ncbi:MAG: hypothetical protein ACREP2_08280 [Rhodanobacteraceae bacterium]
MKTFIVLMALLVGGRAMACDIHSNADDAVARVIHQRGFNLAGYDALCAKLKRADAELVINEWEGRVGNNEVAFADVWVTNRAKSAFSLQYGNGVRYGGALMADPDDLLYGAITDAIEALMSKGGLDTALAEVRASEHEHRLADAILDRDRARKAQARKGAH